MFRKISFYLTLYFRHYKNKFKWAYQEVTRGFSDDELGHFYITISKFVLPRLETFKEYKQHTFPVGLNPEKWQLILDDMIYFHESMAHSLDYPKNQQYNKNRVRRGKYYFLKYYGNLW